MKGQSVLAVILVLLCFCIPFGNGDERIKDARKLLHYNYGKFLHYSKDLNVFRPRSTIYRHLGEVNDKLKKWQDWLQDIIGYSPEKLSNPTESFMSEDEQKLATEYHLWQSGWYYVRFMTLDKAAKRGYPRPDKCRNAASTAFKHFAKHIDLYRQYYQALRDEAQQNIMREIKFPNYVGSKGQKYVENDAVLSVKVQLKTLINRLLTRKKSMDSSAVQKAKSIKTNLVHTRMTLNETFISVVRDVFPVEDFSQPPDEATRRNVEFVEVAWLLNRYRSLWYEIRRNEFQKYLRLTKEGLKAEFIQRVEEAIEFTNKLFQTYDLLCRDYYNVLRNYNPESAIIAQNNPFWINHFMQADEQIRSSGNEGLEKIQWKPERKRKRLKIVRNADSPRNPKPSKLRYLNEYLEIVRSDSSRLDVPDPFEVVAMEVESQAEKEGFSSAKRCKSFEENRQAGHQSKQRKSSDGEEGVSDFVDPIADPNNQVVQTAVPADSDMQFGANLSHETKVDLALQHIPYTNALSHHQPQGCISNERVHLGTEWVTEASQNEMTQEVFYEPGFEKEISYDYRSTDDAFLEVLFQPASKGLGPSFLENRQLHGPFMENQCSFPTSNLAVENCQPELLTEEREGKVEWMTNSVIQGQETLLESETH